MTLIRCHPLIVAALVVMATTSASVYATDGVTDDGVGVTENDVQDENIEGEVITVNVSTDGQLQWQNSQDHGSPTSINWQGSRSRPHHHRHRRRCHGLARGCGRHRGHHGGRMRGSGRIRFGRGRAGRRHHQLRSCVGCGRWMEAGNMTMDQRLVGQCERLDARLAGDATAASNLTRNELIARYIARKMHRFGVTDAELRQTVSALLTRRFHDMSTCCQQVETEPKIACVRQAMLSRFQRICNGVELICPWMLLRNSTHESRQPAGDDDDDDTQQQQQQQQPNMTATCCPLQDSERLGCFLNEMAAHRQRWRESMAQRALTQSREMRTAAGRSRGMRRARMSRVGGYRN